MQQSEAAGARAAELLSQLSNPDRIRILSELQKEPLKLSDLAKRIDMSATETLRQLQRLTDARLLEKTPEATYRVTLYASLVLQTASPLEFIAEFRDFFVEHDAAVLPCEFRARLADLSGCVLSPSTVETFNRVTGMLRDARESIHATIEVGFDPALQIMRQRLAEGLRVRWLMQESFLPAARTLLASDDKLPELRYVPRLLEHVYLTDHAAAFGLRQNDGTMSYAVFMGQQAPFLRWAGDLFAYEWQKAKPWSPL